MQNENEHTYDNGWRPKEVKLKPNYKFYNRNIFFIFFSQVILFVSRVWVFFARLILGVKIKGRKNKHKVKGAIIICNHVHPLDSFFLVTNFHFRKVYVTMLESNLGFGWMSVYMRLAAAVPIPTDRRQIRRFGEQTEKTLKKGRNILFFAEAALMPYCDHIRNFLPGAFHYAVSFDRPILPCCITFHKPKGIYKLFHKKKPVMRLNFLDPYYIKQQESRKDTIETATQEVHKIIADYFKQNSDYYYENGEKIQRGC